MASTSSGHKRKLSGAALASTEQKRQKRPDEESPTAAMATVDRDDDDEHDKDGDGDRDDDADADGDGDGALDTPTTTNKTEEPLTDPGPHVFLCWADGISFLLDGEESCYFALKSTCIAAWKKVAHLPKADRHEALEDHICTVERWTVIVPSGAAETPAAKGLIRDWEAVSAAVRSETGAGEAGGGSEDGEVREEEEKPGWWFEVDVQSERPDKGASAFEVVLEGLKGTWWITGFRSADQEGRSAMADLVDYLCVDDL